MTLSLQVGIHVRLARPYTYRGADAWGMEPKPGAIGVVTSLHDDSTIVNVRFKAGDWTEDGLVGQHVQGILTDISCLDVDLPDLTKREEVEAWLES